MAGMTLTRAIAGVSVLFAFLFSAPAAAQMACLPSDRMVSLLADRFDEHPTGLGITEGGRGVAILFTARDGSTWTLAIRVPERDLTCVRAAGQHWQTTEPPLPGDPS